MTAPALTALLAVPEVQPLYERVFNSMPGSCIPDNAVWRQNKADLDALLTAIVAARDAQLLDGTVEGPWRFRNKPFCGWQAYLLGNTAGNDRSIYVDGKEEARAVANIINTLEARLP